MFPPGAEEEPFVTAIATLGIAILCSGVLAIGYLTVFEGSDERHVRARTWAAAVGLTFGVGAFVTPPDPVTQLVSVPVLFAAALPAAYLLVYREGLAAIRSQVPGL